MGSCHCPSAGSYSSSAIPRSWRPRGWSETAASLPGVSVVSMSFGSSEFSYEKDYDSAFTTPCGHEGVTFVASTGDSGSPGEYPAFSPNVVAVGGTSLQLNADSTYQSETAWSYSGGGISAYETEPTYQQSIQSTGQRTIPDVAFDADPEHWRTDL